jgi:rhodanese-related sulfurtransferase
MNKEISAEEAAKLRLDRPETVFLDVREDSELAICRIDGALHIPMGEVAERHEALPKEVPLVVFCHHGMRSMHVLQYLEAKGFENAYNLRGGIHAWATSVDGNLTKY